MNVTSTAQTQLDCVVVGHYDLGFTRHEKLVRSKGIDSGDYRTLRMDFVTFDNRKIPYLDILSDLTGQYFHWTEMTQVAPAYLTSFLLRRGFRAEFASFFPTRRAELEDLVSRARVVALTTTLYLNSVVATEVVSQIRAINPKAHIVMGGPLVDNLNYHVNDDAFRYLLDDIGADTYVLERQGETTLANILQCLKAGGDLSKVKNCFVRHKTQFVFTGKEQEANVLDENPIEWNRFAHKTLGPTLQTRTASSCPFRCTFCDFPVRAGKFETQSLDLVERELSQIREREGVANVVFIDDTFNAPVGRFKEILRMMIRNKFDFRWYSYFRCNMADQELCDLMGESGCAGVFLGIESGDATVLRNMKKMAAPEQFLRGIKFLNEAGIMSFASLIVGFPGETRQSLENTIQLLNEAQPTFFRGEPWYYNQRSPIHNDRERFKIEGNGYRWEHSTMDWAEACDLALHVFKNVRGPTWLPMYDMDFWIMPYLTGKGFSLEQIRGFVSLCDDLLAVELGMQKSLQLPGRPIIEEQVRNYCAGLNL